MALLLSCTPAADPLLQSELDAAKREVAVVLPAVPGPFAPDVVLHVSPPLTERLVQAGLTEIPTIRDERVVLRVGLATELHVKSAELRPGRADRFQVASHLDGHVDVDGGMFGKTRVPIGVDVVAAVEIASETTADRFRATARPAAVTDFALDLPDVPAALAVVLRDPAVREPLRARVEEAFLQRPPMRLAEWPRDGMPARGFRVEPEGAGLRVSMLSTAVHAGRVDEDAPAAKGFRLDAAADTVLWLARAQALARAPVDLQGRAASRLPEALAGYAPEVVVLPVPQALRLDGDRFAVDVRLWRLVDGGAAWWRQYEATGTVGVRDEKVALVLDGVEPGATSPGAGTVDPLAAISEAVLLASFTEPLSRTLPAARQGEARGHAAKATVDRVDGSGGTVRVHGTLKLDE